MDDLKEQKCISCHSGASKATNEELTELKRAVPDWNITDIDGIPRLEREFQFKDFKDAQAFAMNVAELAEEEGHHPAILIEWGKVTVSWWSHAIEGLHKNDFICAAKTSDLL